MQQETKVSSGVISGSGASDGAEFGSSFLRTMPVTRESSSRKHGQTGLSLSHAGIRCFRLSPILPLATGRRCHLPSSERVRSASLCHWERQYDASSLRHKDTALGDSTLQPDHRQRVSNCCPDVRVISWREHSRFRGLCRSGAKRYKPETLPSKHPRRLVRQLRRRVQRLRIGSFRAKAPQSARLGRSSDERPASAPKNIDHMCIDRVSSHEAFIAGSTCTVTRRRQQVRAPENDVALTRVPVTKQT
jgi:hypothetical protein